MDTDEAWRIVEQKRNEINRFLIQRGLSGEDIWALAVLFADYSIPCFGSSEVAKQVICHFIEKVERNTQRRCMADEESKRNPQGFEGKY